MGWHRSPTGWTRRTGSGRQRRIHHEHRALEFGCCSSLEVKATFLAFYAVVIVLRPTIRAKHASTSVRTESLCSFSEPTERTLRGHGAQANSGGSAHFSYERQDVGCPAVKVTVQIYYLMGLPPNLRRHVRSNHLKRPRPVPWIFRRHRSLRPSSGVTRGARTDYLCEQV